MELYKVYDDTRKSISKHGEGWFYAIGFFDKRRFPPKAPKGAGVLWFDGKTGIFLKNDKNAWHSVKITEDACKKLKEILENNATGWKRNQFYDISARGRIFYHILKDGNIQMSVKKG